ncbi:MAG: glycosyltransferase family 4 protein [Microcystaceae cyanobacterium]
MKILLIGTYANDQSVSMTRFSKLVEQGLIQKGYEVLRKDPSPIFGQLHPSPVGFGKWLGYIDKLILFPFQLRQLSQEVDLVCICDQAYSHYTHYLQDKTHLVICHDMFGIRGALGEIKENIPSWTGKQYQRIILSGLKRAQWITCSSETTRMDVLRITKAKQNKTTVIQDCVNINYKIMPQQEAVERATRLGIYVNSYSWLLHVGGNQWYKNRLGLLRIFNYLKKNPEMTSVRLVMVGKPWTKEIKQFIIHHNLEEQVVELVALSNDNLRAMYSIATALIFPSLQEGFGVPMIEAQICGCPVFTSNRLPMTDICRDAAVYFEPDAPEEAGNIIAETLLNSQKMKHIREAGLNNATRFTFESMMDSYDMLFRQIASAERQN